MFHRKRFELVENAVSDFAEKPGVTFAVHVFYRDAGNPTLQVASLGAPQNKTSLLGVSSHNHPDQEYLRAVSPTTLAAFSGKTIVRVEVDDTITFCGTGMGQCGLVVPDWIKSKFPGAPALLFVHKCDRAGHTLLGKHVYDLFDADENDSWDWTTGDQTDHISGAPAIRFVAVYTCNAVRCLNKGKEMALIEVKAIDGKGREAFAHLPADKAKCKLCTRLFEYQKTRLLRGGEKPAIELSWGD